jgi:allophanate hydrolase subunit 1
VSEICTGAEHLSLKFDREKLSPIYDQTLERQWLQQRQDASRQRMHWEYDVDYGGTDRQELGDVPRKTGDWEPDMADIFAQGRRLGF